MSDMALPVTPLITGDRTLSDVTRDICVPLERRPGALWWAGFLLSFSLLVLGAVAVTYQVAMGIGTWGLNRTVGWAFDITNFVFWIGIGHAGTLISAILFLFRQKWRTSVNRSAEAMTLFAVMCAGVFPLIHMGRPWLAYWIAPYPNTRGPLWVNFRSPLVWDFFAISTYFLVSLIFWYVGLVPDLATVRDRTPPGWRRRLLEIFSLGWDGSFRTWHRYETVYLLLAGLATPLLRQRPGRAGRADRLDETHRRRLCGCRREPTARSGQTAIRFQLLLDVHLVQPVPAHLVREHP